MSSVIDSGSVAIGAVAVLVKGFWTLSVEFNTVSISKQLAGTRL
ncbi:hypothetical protein [Petrachloros mirabilis]